MTQQRVAAVILAAGAATRFGSPKQVATLWGEPLIRHAVRHTIDAGAASVLVVVGANAEIVSKTLDDIHQVSIVVNDEWATGIASSLRKGIAAVSPECDGILFVAADQPLVDSTMLRTLIAEFSSGHRLVASEYDDIIGIPALVGKEYLTELASVVTRDRGASPWLRSLCPLVKRVPMKAAAFDVDTKESLRVIEQSFESANSQSGTAA